MTDTPSTALYEHHGDEAVNPDVWPLADTKAADGADLYHYAFDKADGQPSGASDEWVPYVPPTDDSAAPDPADDAKAQAAELAQPGEHDQPVTPDVSSTSLAPPASVSAPDQTPIPDTPNVEPAEPGDLDNAEHTAPEPGTAADPADVHDEAVLDSSAKGQPYTEAKATLVNPDANPAALQFPSLAGEPDAEIVERSADQTSADGAYEKVFIILPGVAGWQPPADDHDWHDANKAGVLNEAINRGLHPDAEAVYVGCELQIDGVSLALRYQVDVTPAAVDPDASTTLTPAHSENIAGSYPDNLPQAPATPAE